MVGFQPSNFGKIINEGSGFNTGLGGTISGSGLGVGIVTIGEGDGVGDGDGL